MRIKSKKFAPLWIAAILFLSSCSGVYYSPKDSETLSRGVYATRDSISVSRVDLAKKYIDEASKIVVPPKKPIVVTPISKKSKDSTGAEVIERVVVLPESAPANTVRVNSQEFQELLKDKQTLANYISGEESWKKYSEEVATKQRQDAENNRKKDVLIDSQQRQIKSLVWYRNIVWGVLGAIGIGLVLYVLTLLLKAGVIGAKIIS